MVPELATLLPLLSDAVIRAAEKAPEPEDVKAGYVALAIFLGLIVAVGLLGFSMFKRMRNVESAHRAGVYDPAEGDKPADTPDQQ